MNPADHLECPAHKKGDTCAFPVPSLALADGMSLRACLLAHTTCTDSDRPHSSDRLSDVRRQMDGVCGGPCPKAADDLEGYVRWHARYEAWVRLCKVDALLEVLAAAEQKTD